MRKNEPSKGLDGLPCSLTFQPVLGASHVRGLPFRLWRSMLKIAGVGMYLQGLHRTLFAKEFKI